MEFQLTYRLIQQTPIIHFQHDQQGATLRATEVKPKLDRFIIKKMGGKDKVPTKWFIGDTKALDYKMRIVSEGIKRTVDLGFGTSYGIFYGNMGNNETKKKGVVGNCILTVTCFFPELLKKLNDTVKEFFIVTNFGTMQNKGFGSYIVDGSDVKPYVVAEYLKNKFGADKCFTFKAGEKVFDDIKNVYSFMKSGRNFRGYQRSLLFLFMHGEKYKIGNEKAWLKQKGFAPCDVGVNSQRWHNNPQGHESYYVRALLGVCDHIEFIEDLNNRGKKTTVNIKSSVIERLSSPIKFKVIGNDVYYVAEKIPDKIYGAEFEFSSKKGSEVLAVPTKEQLGEDYMSEFLAYCMTKLNNETFSKFRDCSHIRIREVR